MNPPTLKIAYFFLMGNYGQYLRFWDMSSLRLLPRSRTVDPSRGKVRLQPHQDASFLHGYPMPGFATLRERSNKPKPIECVITKKNK